MRQRKRVRKQIKGDAFQRASSRVRIKVTQIWDKVYVWLTYPQSRGKGRKLGSKIAPSLWDGGRL